MFNNLIGPGRKSNLRPIRVTRYMPHQGDQETARRRARIRIDPLAGAIDTLMALDSAATRAVTWRKKGGRR